MHEKYLKVLADTASAIFRERLGLEEAVPEVAPIDLPRIELPVAQVIEFQGRDSDLEGQFVLGFSRRDHALALAGALAGRLGMASPDCLNETAIDLLSEFMNLVVGRTISAWDKMGTPVEFGPPSPLLQARIESVDGFRTSNYLISISLRGQRTVLAVGFSISGGEPAEKLRILVVDDSRTLRSFVAGRLEAAGYQVAQAADGREALEAHRRFRPHVSIMDLVMPNMGGLEAIMAIKDGEPEARFIILTSSDRMDERVTATTLGVSEYLIKPLSERALLDSLERMLGTEVADRTPCEPA